MTDTATVLARALTAAEGLDVEHERKRFRTLLQEAFPHDRRERFLLATAARAGVPSALAAMDARTDVGLEARLTRHLHEDYGISRTMAQWAVRTWADALRQSMLP